MKKTTAEWVQKAEVDYRGARKLAPSRPPMHDLVCFHCQAAAEKYLKAIVDEQGLTVPRTHDLEDLLSLLLRYHPHLWTLRRGLKTLNRYAVEPRYPGFHSSKRQAASTLRWAGEVRATCRKILGLRPPRSRHYRSP